MQRSVSEMREVVLRPRSRRVAELIGYRGWLSYGSQTLALHPERVHPVGVGEHGRSRRG